MHHTLNITLKGEPLYDRGLAFAYATYLNTHNVTIHVYPDILVIALQDDAVIIGTMGLILEHGVSHFFEQSEPLGAFERLAPNQSRDALAEISRFALSPHLTPRRSRFVAQQLAAYLYTYGHAIGIRYFGFVGKPSFQTFLKPLGIEPIMLGLPTFEHVQRTLVGTYPDQKNLFCFGFILDDVSKLRQYIAETSNLHHV